MAQSAKMSKTGASALTCPPIMSSADTANLCPAQARSDSDGIPLTLDKSGRLTAYPNNNVFPAVAVITTGDAVWKIDRMIVTSQEEYRLLTGEYGLDYFDGGSMPLA